jgi:hypothetical protein
MNLAQRLMQEIGQLVYQGHATQIELEQALQRIKELEAQVPTNLPVKPDA